MSQRLGKKLHDARVKRALSVEEVAHVTKLRPEKIHALEADDYTQFANNAYAKGFLQIYSRYLGVNATETLEALDTSNPITLCDYQYLSNGVQRQDPERVTFSFAQKRQVPSIVPLVVFAALLVLGYVGFQFYVNWQRVNGDSARSRERSAADEPAATAQTGLQPAEPAPAAPQAPPQAPPVAPAEPAPTPVAAAPVLNEVRVAPIKKTWITVRRDDPSSAPVFEDFLYPDARPLLVKGASIYIEARDPSAIHITKNGAPIAYAPNAEIR